MIIRTHSFMQYLERVFAIVVFAVVSLSCDMDKEYEYSTSCVKYYHLIEPSLMVKYDRSGGRDQNVKVIKVYGRVAQTVTNQSEGEEKELFDKLCVEHGDVSFNRHFTLHGYTGFSCYYPDYSSINISCEQDYDADHPAGSSLNDLFRIYCAALYNWVQNNYVRESDAHPDKRFLSLDKVTENDIKMLAHMDSGWGMFWLLPVSLPDDLSEKCYHIDCRGIDGLMYSGTVNCDIDFASELNSF